MKLLTSISILVAIEILPTASIMKLRFTASCGCFIKVRLERSTRKDIVDFTWLRSGGSVLYSWIPLAVENYTLIIQYECGAGNLCAYRRCAIKKNLDPYYKKTLEVNTKYNGRAVSFCPAMLYVTADEGVTCGDVIHGCGG